MSVLPAYLYVCPCVQTHGSQISWNWSCGQIILAAMWVLELNLGPLEEQPVPNGLS